MNNLLRHAYFLKPCNACGGEYPVTLLDIFEQQRLRREWTSARPCDACHSEYLSLVDAVPPQQLENLAQAWDELQADLNRRSLRLTVGPPEQENKGRG